MYDYQSNMLTTTGSGLQELEVVSSDNGFDAIQTDAVEFYYYSGVVSEYKCGLGTVLLVWCWLVSP